MSKTPAIERIELFPLHVPFREAVRAAMARSQGGLGMAIPAEEPWTGGDFVIARLTAAGASPDEMIRKVYLSVFCRQPTEDELATALGYFTAVSTPEEAAQDLMWALINSPAFLFNR